MRDVGAQDFAVAAFTNAGDAKHHADAPAFAALRPADAHAYAVTRGTRAALALHLRVFPVEIERQRAAHAGAQIAVARGEATGSLRLRLKL